MTRPASILVDGFALSVEPGIPLSAVLHRERGGVLRRTALSGDPRGIFCGMGVCFDCLVTVAGKAGVRACMTPVADGMRVDTV